MFKLRKMTIRAGFVVLTALAMILASSYAPSQVLALGTAPSLGAAMPASARACSAHWR